MSGSDRRRPRTAIFDSASTRWLLAGLVWICRQIRLIGREVRSPRTLALSAICATIAIPITIWLAPGIQVQTLGQDITLSARPPSTTLSGYGQVVEGPRAFDLPHLHIYGPIRPSLSLIPQSSEELTRLLTPKLGQETRDGAARTIVMGFVWWWLLAFAILMGLGLPLCISLGQIPVFRHQDPTLPNRQSLTVHQVIAAMLTVAVLWTGAGVSAAVGARDLTHVHSLPDLFGVGDLALRQSPSPVGPILHGYKVVVLGDSRAERAGGPLVANPTPDDRLCGRSSDGLGPEIQLLTGNRTLSLACPNATTDAGFEGPQERAGHLVPAQIAIAKQVRGEDDVIYEGGPDDLWWSSLLGYCYYERQCNDQLTENAFQSQMDGFTQDYYQRIIPDLRDLPGHPRIIVMLPYYAMDPSADCPDAQGLPGMPGLHKAPPHGHPGDKIRLINQRITQLRDVLTAGALSAGFKVADPPLRMLCAPSTDRLGADIQGIHDPAPYHPTGLGSRDSAWSAIAQMNAP